MATAKRQTAYILIGRELYIAVEPTPESPGNRYPCSLGTFTGEPGDPPGGAITATNGDILTLWGSRYEVNALTTHGDCEDEIDLELVLLCEPGGPEAESAAYDDHLSSLGSHIEPPTDDDQDNAPCTACNAASLVESALDILNPDDCTISNVCRGDCGTVTFDVLSDDCGPYRCRVTVEILEA
jgi:hypothetical protein